MSTSTYICGSEIDGPHVDQGATAAWALPSLFCTPSILLVISFDNYGAVTYLAHRCRRRAELAIGPVGVREHSLY